MTNDGTRITDEQVKALEHARSTAESIERVLGIDTVPEDPFGTGDLAAAQYEPFSFTAMRLVLAALADKAISVVPTGNSMPVLKHFLVHVAPGSLRMAASDLELSVLAATPAVTVEVTQTLVLPARKLLAILKEAPDGPVTVDVAGEYATVRAGNSSWTLFLADASEYPALPDPAEVEMRPVARHPFLDALKTVRHAVGRDFGRASLMQVDIAVRDDVATVTASDGVRFARTVLPGFPLSMRIPAGALDSLVKTLEGSDLDEVQVGETDGQLVFRIGSNVFLANKAMAKFPDVEKMLLRPALENRLVLVVDKAELANAIRRVRINADEETSALGLQLSSGQVAVIARDKYKNRAEEIVAAKWDGPERLVVINHQFLAELLAVHPFDQCMFRLGPESGKKRSVLMLQNQDEQGHGIGPIGIIYQMLAAQVGYGD